MDYKEFKDIIVNELEEKLPKGIRFIEHKSFANNGIERKNLLIEQKNRKMHPCIHLGEFYDAYSLGELSIDDIVDSITNIYKKAIKVKDIECNKLSNWDNAKQHIYCRLINTKKNEKLLECVPYREFLDLAVVYYLQVEEMTDDDGMASILIKNENMEAWDITEKDLYDASIINSDTYNSAEFENISKVISRLIGLEEVHLYEDLPMYVLSNKSKMFGAVQLMNSEQLKQIGEFLDSDYYVLPSSVHEVIVVPITDIEQDIDELADMVRSINDNEVELKDILSYSIYCYNRELEELRIVS